MEIDDLKLSLSQYELQLSQVNDALKITPEGDEFDSLTSLKSDLQELIDLTNENVLRLSLKNESSTDIQTKEEIVKEKVVKKNEDPFEDEYALFMAEMEESGAYEEKKSDSDQSLPENNANNDPDIEEELSSLQGMKCSALFSHKWGGAPTLYNAMVCSVVRDSPDGNTHFNDIQVRVLFTNPTHIEMVPCPYFLDGDCKFSDEKCRFSHGEVVSLSTLKEAREPDCSSLKVGSRVLAKIKQDEEPTSSKNSEKYLLWHRAILTTVNFEEHTCRVKLEHDTLLKSVNRNDYEVDFGSIFPLTDDISDSDTDSDSSTEFPYHPTNHSKNSESSMFNNSIVEQSLSNNPGSIMLGDWEKHTRGMGSKLMMKMGYITGSGLGPQGEGIVQPIPCHANPSGRSVDHCMELREKTDLDDPIKAEKKLRRLQKKQEENEKKAYERAKNREKHNVFNFLNKTLSAPAIQDDSTKNVSDLKSSSSKNLNIEQFKLSEDIKKIEKDISKLKESIVRNNKNSDVQRGLSVQLNAKLKDIKELKSRQDKISSEQNIRKDQRKLSVF